MTSITCLSVLGREDLSILGQRIPPLLLFVRFLPFFPIKRFFLRASYTAQIVKLLEANCFMLVMLTSSQTEQHCPSAFGWRTAMPLCHEGLSRNAERKQRNERLGLKEVSRHPCLKKCQRMSLSPALPVWHDELFLFSAVTSQTLSCWWTPCYPPGNLPVFANMRNSPVELNIVSVYAEHTTYSMFV